MKFVFLWITGQQIIYQPYTTQRKGTYKDAITHYGTQKI